MYKIMLDSKTIADSASERLSVVSAELSREVNKCGSFVFTITADNPLYNEIETRTSIVSVIQDNKQIFEGVAVSEAVDFHKQKTITCEGSLTFLNDSVQRQARYQNVTVRQYLEAIVTAHNQQVDTFKRFTVGVVTVTDPNNAIYRFTNYETTMECIQNDLVDSLGGFLRVRTENGTRYLDYLADSPRTNSQTVRIGKNLLDLAVNLDAADVATVVVPLGAKIEGEEDVEGLEKRVDIKSVNSGKDYLENAEAIANFGRVTKVVVFDSVTVPANLKTKGQQFLNDSQFEKMVIEASAFDLSLADSDVMEFDLLDKIRVVSAPHGLDKDFILSAISYDLNSPENAQITLGIETDLRLTARTALMEYTADELPEKVLSQAAANASALIKSSGAGNVYFDYDEDGVIKQILIMDTNDKATAQKVWRWNANGLGYSSTGYDGTYGLAMTMDGAIVADFITAGRLVSRDPETSYELDTETGTVIMKNAIIKGGLIEIVSDASNKNLIQFKYTDAIGGDIVSSMRPNGFYSESDQYGGEGAGLTPAGLNMYMTKEDGTLDLYYVTPLTSHLGQLWAKQFTSPKIYCDSLVIGGVGVTVGDNSGY